MDEKELKRAAAMEIIRCLYEAFLICQKEKQFKEFPGKKINEILCEFSQDIVRQEIIK